MSCDIPRIQSLIAHGNTDLAFDKLKECLKSNPVSSSASNAIILLEAQFKQNQNHEMLSVVSNEEIKVVYNKINKALLDFIEKYLEGENAGNGRTQPDGHKSILFITASPFNESKLRLGKEIREIEQELKQASERDKLRLVRKDAARVNELLDGLLNEPSDIVHFSGHGTNEGIVLMDDSDNAHIVKGEKLATLFSQFSENINCVFLNSCYSHAQAEMIHLHIKYVIGMDATIPDETAINFSKNFYKSLGAGRDIEFSFNLAKNAIDLNNLEGGHVPVLLKR